MFCLFNVHLNEQNYSHMLFQWLIRGHRLFSGCSSDHKPQSVQVRADFSLTNNQHHILHYLIWLDVTDWSSHVLFRFLRFLNPGSSYQQMAPSVSTFTVFSTFSNIWTQLHGYIVSYVHRGLKSWRPVVFVGTGTLSKYLYCRETKCGSWVSYLTYYYRNLKDRFTIYQLS